MGTILLPDAPIVENKLKMIPPTLLTKPLPPEKLNLMNDEEKRLYNI
jgi:hypothetical protein